MPTNTKNNEREKSAQKSMIGGALGAGAYAQLFDKNKIKAGFKKKDERADEMIHNGAEKARERKAREKFAKPINEELNKKLKDAKSVEDKKKLYSEADKRFKAGFKFERKPFVGEGLRGRIGRAAGSLKNSGKAGLAMTGYIAALEGMKGWNRKKDKYDKRM